MIDHGSLPAISTARLPQAYEAARTALAECARLDECQEWADRMEALASYARQSEDETLLKQAMRIKARAIDRCGELLRQIEAAPGTRTDLEPDAGADTRFAIGEKAGLSRRQIVTALRVNKVPRPLFEELVECDNPPTVTALAKIGTRSRIEQTVIDQLAGRDPSDFEQATRLIGLFTWIEARTTALNTEAALRGLNDEEMDDVKARLEVTLEWFDLLKEAVDAV